MSFSLEFYAHSSTHAVEALNHPHHKHVPESVRSFILQALSGIPAHLPVHIKAHGHLYTSNDYTHSNTEIRVTPVEFWTNPDVQKAQLGQGIRPGGIAQRIVD